MLNKSFYIRDSLIVARELLGKKLCFQGKESLIVETEAYTVSDPGSHAFNKRTPRNSIMFDQGGKLYVYFCYGMYNLMNVVTDEQDVPSAVLIRALEPLNFKAKTSGPGLLTKALGVTREHNGLSVLGPDLWIEDAGLKPEVVQTTRVGLSAGQELPYRFYIKDNQFISRK